MLPTRDLDYELPEHCIALAPAPRREDARLMVVRASDPSLIEHAQVKDLPRYLRANDLLVLNATRVLPARLEGVRIDTGGAVQGLYLSPAQIPGVQRTWSVLLSGKRLRENGVVGLHDHSGNDSGVRLRLLSHAAGDLASQHGAWLVSVEDANGQAIQESDTAILDRVGLTALPPYIRAARKRVQVATDEATDRERYQTTYAKDTATGGSVAAPTAGLHLTPDLLASLAAMGVRRAEVVLHVGLGTFANVETEFIEQHPMHHEWCEMTKDVMDAITHTRESLAEQRGRVFAVGTTAARTIESFAARNEPGQISTNILITPGYQWRWVDGLLTNFHLPRSTLMAMVASLLQRGSPEHSGVTRLKNLYETAVREGYRFYSFGDAMLILP
ncbi:MAG: tRNA preQ1(34) S-adenosylmethionine ribosyltransferase-isomerase QueA [Phycisphaerales bacterium]